MPAAEITRAETSQRARLLRVHSYEVALDLTRGEKIFGPVSVIRFDSAEPGAASHADLIADAVHEITLNGVPLDPAAVYTDGRIALPYAGRYVTELAKIWATRSGHLRVQLSELLFPYPAASPELLTQIDDFLAAPRDPALIRVLTERRDTIQRALRSRALRSRALHLRALHLRALRQKTAGSV